ncbi:MAG: carbohydrate kinase [Succinivibrio sp.]|nr:carbohydrate kinase [Succinivibrio sp.]
MLKFEKLANGKSYGVGIGEVLFDVFADKATLGGAPANFAFHLAQLGTPTKLVSAVGDDELGHRACALLKEKQLEMIVSTLPFPTGQVKVSLDEKGVGTYDFLEDTAYDHLPYNPELAELASQSSIVCFGSLAQRSPQSHETILKFLNSLPTAAIRVFDVNLRQDFFTKTTLADSLHCTDIFKCNEDELPVLSSLLALPAAADRFYAALREQFGVQGLIFTEGGTQSTVYLNDEISVQPSLKVEVVDTIGAGDSFTASLMAALFAGKKLPEAHALATRVSGYVCTQRGAMPVLPVELKALFR